MHIHNTAAARVLALAGALALLPIAAAAEVQPSAVSFTTLYSFPDTLGASPAGGLYRDAGGALYGTTILGGTASASCPQGCGMVFKLTPPVAPSSTWTRTILHKFTASEGSFPYSSLTPGSGGVLYGATSAGNTFNKGSIFRLTPASGNTWKFKVIRVLGGNIGSNPYNDLMVDGTGAVYGMTSVGGGSGFGTVFKLKPPAPSKTEWTSQILLTFNGSNGKYGAGGLVADAAGALYGVTSDGGSGNLGVLFRLTPPATPAGTWAYRALHQFGSGTKNGANPYGALVLRGSTLYGTTYAGGASGGGTVYRLVLPATPSGNPAFSILRSMTAASDGSAPYVGLTVDGVGRLYGSNYLNGPGGQGSLFKLAPPVAPSTAWTFSLIHAFSGHPDGDDPTGVLIRDSAGYFYGTTQYGGASDKGMVFRFKP